MSILSMTGFGRGRCELAGRRLVVEIRAVNHRFLELKQRLPWSDPGLELRLGQLVRERLHRGAIAITVRDEASGEAVPAVAADLALAQAYQRALTNLAEACGLAELPTLALIAAQPGVLVAAGGLRDEEGTWAALRPALSQALDELVAARRREGQALRDDLLARLGELRRFAQTMTTLAAETPHEARRRLEERLARLLQPGEIDPQRLAQEVALLADRADIAEELTRFNSHVDEVTRLLDETRPAGRRLDFLTQELHREVNTMGAKSQRLELVRLVVDAKAEVERLREQVQNVE